jgi:HSP20 family protein
MMYRTSLTAPMFGLRREIDRLFEDTFQNAGGDRAGWVPSANVRETKDGYLFDFELPGMSPEQVEVTCDNGVLLVRGERTEERKEGEEGRYHVFERSYGSFSRSFQLPQGVDEDSIEASFENGLLRLRVPKAALPQPRRIEIQGSQKSERGSQQQISGSPRSEGSNARKNGSSEPKARGEQGDQKGRGETTERSRGEQTDRTRGEMAASSNR